MISLFLSVLLFCLIVFTCLRSTLIRWIRLRQDYKNISLLPVSKISFLGNISQFTIGADQIFLLLNSLSEKVQKSGQGIFCIWFATKPNIILCLADGLEGFINNSKQLVKSADYRFLHPWLRTGLLTSSNEKWKTRRRLITPSFHNNDLLNDFMLIFDEQSKVLADRFEQLSLENTQTHNLYPFLSACTLDIIAEAATGTHPNAQKGDLANEFVNATIRIGEIINIRARSPWLWPEWIFDRSSIGREHKQKLSILHDFTRKIIEERLRTFDFDVGLCRSNESNRRLAFLDSLLTQMKIEKLSIDDIQEEVDTFIFEGHDTTAAALYYLLYLVGSHQHVQDKIHQEIDSIFGDDLDRVCTTDDIQRMVYLDAVVKESLRLLPSVPFIGREAQEDFVYRGQTIRQGTTVNIFIYGIHRDEKIFPNADKFDPSRFEQQNEQRSPYIYIPFSAGSRNCIGQRFAALEERVILSTLFRRFSFKSTQKIEDFKLSSDLILRTNVPIEMEIKRRF